jgi:hypothetical protein
MYGLYFMALLEAIDRFAPLIVDYSSPDWLKTVLLVLTIVVAVLRVMPQGDDPHVPRD